MSYRTDYRIIRSGRRTIGLEVTENGLLVRAPLKADESDIEKVIAEHSRWIEGRMAKVRREQKLAREAGILEKEEIEYLTRRAKAYIPARVAYYEPLVGVTSGRVTIRMQKTKWGSCSSNGNLNFNCLLMLAPLEVIDSIVVHELCHLKEMNHSASFYDEVLRVFPEYRKWNKWLKENGGALMRRAGF